MLGAVVFAGLSVKLSEMVALLVHLMREVRFFLRLNLNVRIIVFAVVASVFFVSSDAGSFDRALETEKGVLRPGALNKKNTENALDFRSQSRESSVVQPCEVDLKSPTAVFGRGVNLLPLSSLAPVRQLIDTYSSGTIS